MKKSERSDLAEIILWMSCSVACIGLGFVLLKLPGALTGIFLGGIIYYSLSFRRVNCINQITIEQLNKSVKELHANNIRYRDGIDDILDNSEFKTDETLSDKEKLILLRGGFDLKERH